MQSKPAIRQPKPCGTDQQISHGRGPSQMGWYQFVDSQNHTGDFLDVGAGIGAGMAYLGYLGNDFVRGFDTDPRLAWLPEMTIGTSPLKAFGERAFNVVTCIDVIEHVVDDIEFFAELKALSRRALYVSTPNLLHSHAGNLHHAREYSVAEFVETFKPDEIWGGSPDGWVREKLEKPYSEEWPAMLGVWHVDPF